MPRTNLFIGRAMRHKGREARKGFCFIAFVLILSACGQAADCHKKSVFCAGIVTDTLGIEDHGINQDTWAGLETAQANRSVDRIEYISSVDTRDYEKNIAYFGDNGYDVIITSGIDLRDETLRTADLYPDSVFIGMNQPQAATRANLISITFAEDQIGFAAGLKTKVEIIAHRSPVDAQDAIARFQLQLGADTPGRNFGDLDTAAPNLCDCGCDCEFVHLGLFR